MTAVHRCTCDRASFARSVKWNRFDLWFEILFNFDSGVDAIISIGIVGSHLKYGEIINDATALEGQRSRSL